MTLVKICGMTNTDDVDQAVAAGADMIGFVLVPWSPRAVDLDAVRKLRRHVPRGIEAVGVLADETAGYAAQVLEVAELDRVQVYGPHAAETREVLGERALVGYRLPADAIGADDPVLLDRAFGDEPTAEELAAHWDVGAELGRAGVSLYRAHRARRRLPAALGVARAHPVLADLQVDDVTLLQVGDLVGDTGQRHRV